MVVAYHYFSTPGAWVDLSLLFIFVPLITLPRAVLVDDVYRWVGGGDAGAVSVSGEPFLGGPQSPFPSGMSL